MSDPDEVIYSLRPAAYRRWLGCGMLGLLAALLTATAIDGGLAYWARGILLAGAAGAVLAGLAMWRALGAGLVLTRTELRDGDGRVLARTANVERVDRRAFAVKPSAGFVLILAVPGGAHWAPGLWWRFGRRVGVGGMLSNNEGRSLSGHIDILIAERSGAA